MPPSTPITAAPIARKAPGQDPYAWLQVRDSAEVMDYLKAENAWQEAQLAGQQALRETLFEEIVKLRPNTPEWRLPYLRMAVYFSENEVHNPTKLHPHAWEH